MSEFCAECGNTIDSCCCFPDEIYINPVPKDTRKGYWVAKEHYEQIKVAIERLRLDVVTLKDNYRTLHDEWWRLHELIAEYKEMLRKCNPKENCGCDNARSCISCGGLYHEDNCQYVRLCGGSE